MKKFKEKIERMLYSLTKINEEIKTSNIRLEEIAKKTAEEIRKELELEHGSFLPKFNVLITAQDYNSKILGFSKGVEELVFLLFLNENVKFGFMEFSKNESMSMKKLNKLIKKLNPVLFEAGMEIISLSDREHWPNGALNVIRIKK